MFSGYGTLVLRFSTSFARRRELDADAKAVERAGRMAVRSALAAVYALGRLWRYYMDSYVTPVALPAGTGTGALPADIFGSFLDMLNDGEVNLRRAALKRDAELDTSMGRYDSHPSMARRLELIDQCPEPEGEPRPVPAVPDFQALPRYIRPVQRQILGEEGGSLPQVSGGEWASLAAPALAEWRSQELLAVAGTLGFLVNTVDDVLDLIGNFGRDELVAALPEVSTLSLTPHDPQHRLTTAVVAIIGRALVAADLATWRFCWSSPVALSREKIGDDDIRTLAAHAIGSAEGATRVRSALTGLGADLAIPVLPSQRADRASAREAAPEQPAIEDPGGGGEAEAPLVPPQVERAAARACLGGYIETIRAVPRMQHLLFAVGITLVFVPVAAVLFWAASSSDDVGTQGWAMVAFATVTAVLGLAGLVVEISRRRWAVYSYEDGFIDHRGPLGLRAYWWESFADLRADNPYRVETDKRVIRFFFTDGRRASYPTIFYPGIAALVDRAPAPCSGGAEG